MYKKFFGFTRSPFEISPDPYFFYASPKHREALATIVYGIGERKGCVVISGEVGTGKTLLVRCLLNWMDRNKITFSYVFNTRLNGAEFLHYLLVDFGLPVPGSKAEALHRLNEFLIARYRQGLTTVLVVDEAQNLSLEVLEEIRLLTNLETARQKLLQIVLIGQPELDEKLDSYQVRQLKQRVVFRCQLSPLSEEECRDYLVRRLERAGAQDKAHTLFPPEVVRAIYRHSRGIPRLINTICENALIAAFGQQSQVVSLEMIEEAARDLRLLEPPLPPPATVPDLENGGFAEKLLRLLQSVQGSRAGLEQPLRGE